MPPTTAALLNRATTSSATPPVRVLSPNARHFARRFSGGLNQHLAIQIQHRGGGRSWFESQLTPGQLKDDRGDEINTWYPRLSLSPEQIFDRQKSGVEGSWEVMLDLSRWTAARQVHSNRQVKEVMTAFWSNLLHVPLNTDLATFWRVDYDATIRRHAIDSFDNMLRAAIVHPAMGLNLSNFASTKDAPNENLGRELLELHTVGVGAGYTEVDVKASANLLTGYRVWLGGGPGFVAQYVPSDHYVGPVQVMDFHHDNADPDGREALAQYLTYLAHHPATAGRIARRLCVKFANEQPSDDYVAAVAQAYLDNGTDIPSTLRALVDHPEFKDPDKSIGVKVRTPQEDFVATMRALSIDIQRPSSGDSFAVLMYWLYVYLGNAPFEWPAPNGYPEVNAAWSSAGRVLGSFNMHRQIAGKWWPTKDVMSWSRTTFLPALPATLQQVIDQAGRIVLGEDPGENVSRGIATVLGMPLDRSLTRTDMNAWFMRSVLTCLLDSPLHLHR